VLGLVLCLVLCSCSSPAALPLPKSGPNEVGLRVVLDTDEGRAGPLIKGVLVVTNPYSAINLTQVEEASSPARCQPAFQIYLHKGGIGNPVAFTMACTNRPFLLAHGTTRLRFQVFTTYTQCSPPDGQSVVPVVPCLASGGLPPLPAGSYRTAIKWSEPVPLPTPVPVTVVLRSSS